MINVNQVSGTNIYVINPRKQVIVEHGWCNIASSHSDQVKQASSAKMQRTRGNHGKHVMCANSEHTWCTWHSTSMKTRYEQNSINVLMRGHMEIAMGYLDSPNTRINNSMGHKEIMAIATSISTKHANTHSSSRMVNHGQRQARVTIAWQSHSKRHNMQSEHDRMGIRWQVVSGILLLGINRPGGAGLCLSSLFLLKPSGAWSVTLCIRRV